VFLGEKQMVIREFNDRHESFRDNVSCAVSPALTSPVKWHGGKSYLAGKIVAMMPPHKHFVEPYAGSAAVLLAKNPEGVSEVVNDLNHQLTNFWGVLQRPGWFEEFRRIVEATPVSEVEWHRAGARLNHPNAVQRAVAFFIRCRQSLAGRCNAFTPMSRTRTRRGMNEQASAWLSAIEGLSAVHARLKRVAIRNRPAVEVIRAEDSPGTLFYLDPPYLHSTRTNPNVYALEMTKRDHRELLDVIKRCRGKVMISGYPSTLYGHALADWTRHTFDLPNNAASGASKRRATEVLWTNFEPKERNRNEQDL
jgi:DNA adenine methylase